MSAPFLHSHIAAIGDLPLRSGVTLPAVEIAYTTLGTLSPARDNVILVTHGFTSSHLFIGRTGPAASEGTWSGLVGPGRAIDSDRFFIVSSNMLGSSYGSTAPASLNPATGRPYGPDFPAITLSDIVEAQRRLLAGLGIEQLVAVVGPSYGGFQALTWGIDHPEKVRGLSLSVSGLHFPDDVTAEGLEAQFATDPAWNGGHYYDRGGIPETMARMREATMRQYCIDVLLAKRFPDPAACAAELTRQARAWAAGFDPNAMLVLARAAERFDARPHLGQIQARIQLVLSRTDRLFPPQNGPGVMQAFADAGISAEYYELDSDYGHHAAGSDSEKWAAQLQRFLASLI